MLRKRKLANTRARKEKEEEESITPMNELLEQEDYRNELYSNAVQVVVNRLDSQSKEIGEFELLDFTRRLFSVPENEHRERVEKAKDLGPSTQCVVRVLFEKAEGLAPKDKNGLSDPYCMLAIIRSNQFIDFSSAKLEVVKSTSCKEETLNPEWNESVHLFVSRSQIDDCYVQIQVWDLDANTKGTMKKAGKNKGVGKYMKGVAQAVTRKDDDEDDFLGFITIPLKNVPIDGMDSWFKLRPVNTFQKVTGRIRIKLELNPVHQVTGVNYSDDELFAGLLTLAVRKEYDDFEAKRMENSTEEWNGKLSQTASTLMRDFAEQNCIKLLTRAIIRWEVYMGIHLQHELGVDSLFLDGLLKSLDVNSSSLEDLAAATPSSTRYKIDALTGSLLMFVKKEVRKVADHRMIFSVQKNNYIINLGNLLLSLKKLRSMPLYRYLHSHSPSPETSPDVIDDVIAALIDGTNDYYIAAYHSSLDESLDDDDKTLENEDDPPHGGQDINILIKLSERLFRDLSLARNVYHDVFQKILGLDYHSYVYHVISNNLARDAGEAMWKVNQMLAEIEDPKHVESETKSVLLFRLYLSLRGLTNLGQNAKKVNLPITRTSSLGSEGNEEVVDGISSTNDSSDEAMDMTRYYDWFRPTLIRWLQMSRGRTHDRLRKAVELDRTKAVDEIVKHTSSAVDTVGCLTGHVVLFWKNLKWPDAVDAYTIALRMTNDVANAIETYADLIHRKLRTVGYFDDEGQFDVTEELCLTLNNLQYVKHFVENLPEKMQFEEVAFAVDRHPDGPDGRRVMTTFEALTNVALAEMEKKIQGISLAVGSKLKQEIQKYLRRFAQQATKCGYGANYHNEQNPQEKRKLVEVANKAIQPLMKYIHNNITTLHDWLCEPNFKRILEVLWKVCVQSLKKLALVEYSQHRPFFFLQCRHVLHHHLVQFFHEGGNGLSLQRMHKFDEFRILESELKMRCAKTEELIRLFYMQMYDQQLQIAINPIYGYLNVHAWYHPAKEQLHVDVISANNLAPLDVNGLSDPFVMVRLAPKVMFRKHEQHQTLIEKNTLDPVFKDESFVYQVPKTLTVSDGACIVFTVLDHDVIGSNDLEGEAVIPLNILSGVSDEGLDDRQLKVDRSFRLPLTQPTPWRKRSSKDSRRPLDVTPSNDSLQAEDLPPSFSKATLNDDGLNYDSSLDVSPLLLLNSRSHFDKDADEFSRGRKRLKSAMEK